MQAGAHRVIVLGIETSCDETAAAVVASNGKILSSVVSSQVDLHAIYGGVVPEIASRAHLEVLIPVVDKALKGAAKGAADEIVLGVNVGEAARRATEAKGAEGAARVEGVEGVEGAAGETNGVKRAKGAATEMIVPDAVAATVGPGLAGALLVGASTGKALSLAWGVPFVGVNHLEGHLFAALLDHSGLRDPASADKFPAAVLLVSGGHTLLMSMDAPGSYRLLGRTVDDAAGEAFDKVARYIGLGYPGGPAIENASRSGDPDSIELPRPMIDRGLDFSFSGLKTAVVRAVQAHPEIRTEDVAAAFQKAIVDVLTTKVMRAAAIYGASSVCLAGGVAANNCLRDKLTEQCDAAGIPCYLPSREMCTDNAAMVAAAGAWQLEHIGPSSLNISIDPSMPMPT